MVKPNNNATSSEIEILSTHKTKTVSGKSDLTYHIGRDPQANQYIQIWVNSGNGYFSNEWILVSRIIETLKPYCSEPATSIIFGDLFKGKSVNTPSFLSAALLDAGILKLAEGTKRKFVYTGAELKIDGKAKSHKKPAKNKTSKVNS